MKVAAIQMVSEVSCQANLLSAAELSQQASEEGAELVVLPEYFCILGAVDSPILDSMPIKKS